jgi:hypothetical protein
MCIDLENSENSENSKNSQKIHRNPKELEYLEYISKNQIYNFDKDNTKIYKKWKKMIEHKHGIVKTGNIDIYVNPKKGTITKLKNPDFIFHVITIYPDDYPDDLLTKFDYPENSDYHENNKNNDNDNDNNNNNDIDYPSSHANALIINHDLKTACRYEPHGSNIEMYNHIAVDELIKKIIPYNYTYFSPLSYQSINGPQSFEVSTKDQFIGFCLSWSLKFMHMHLLYPSLNHKEIDDLMLLEDVGSLPNQIRAYTTYITAYSEKSNNFMITRSFVNINDY